MIDLEALDKSRKLFEEAKAYFSKNEFRNCIIEISDKPMDQWEIGYENSYEKLLFLKLRCWHEQIPNITINAFNMGKLYFHYEDNNIAIGQELNSGLIYRSDIHQKKEFNLKDISQEIYLLAKQLQER